MALQLLKIAGVGDTRNSWNAEFVKELIAGWRSQLPEVPGSHRTKPVTPVTTLHPGGSDRVTSVNEIFVVDNAGDTRRIFSRAGESSTTSLRV